jgi:hypothetical protein
MKLLLTSFEPSADAIAALETMIGKPLGDIKVAYIENAYDVYNDEPSLIEGRESLRATGWHFELVDLRAYKENRDGLREKLARNDMFLLTGGNP